MLSELVKVLEEKKAVLETDVSILHERRTLLRAELEKLDKEAGEKERLLASINDQSIKQYKKVWKSYTPPNPFPCPLCFAVHKKLSPLEPLPRKEDVEPFQCKICRESFDIPIELLYA